MQKSLEHQVGPPGVAKHMQSTAPPPEVAGRFEQKSWPNFRNSEA